MSKTSSVEDAIAIETIKSALREKMAARARARSAAEAIKKAEADKEKADRDWLDADKCLSEILREVGMEFEGFEMRPSTDEVTP